MCDRNLFDEEFIDNLTVYFCSRLQSIYSQYDLEDIFNQCFASSARPQGFGKTTNKPKYPIDDNSVSEVKEWIAYQICGLYRKYNPSLICEKMIKNQKSDELSETEIKKV